MESFSRSLSPHRCYWRWAHIPQSPIPPLPPGAGLVLLVPCNRVVRCGWLVCSGPSPRQLPRPERPVSGPHLVIGAQGRGW